MPTDVQPRIKNLRFGLRTLIVGVALLSSGIGLSAKLVSHFTREPTLEELLKKLADEEQRLATQFAFTNSQSVKDWAAHPARIGNMTAWYKAGISYIDRNGDGLADMKYREDPIMSTTEVWWEDCDYDGTFETEVEQGCFHHVTRPLITLISAPTVPSSSKKTSNIN